MPHSSFDFYGQLLARAGGTGGGNLLPPLGGPTQAGTTPGLTFRALLLGGGKCTELDVVLETCEEEKEAAM
jgi:hypothetical protein